MGKPIALSGIRVLSFDIWKTLIKPNGGFTAARVEVFQRRLGLAGSPDEVKPVYVAVSRLMDHIAEETGLDTGLVERVGEICHRLGQPVPPLDPELVVSIQMELGALRCEPQYLPTLLEPDLTTTLAELKARGFRLVLLSNTGFDSGEAMRPALKKLGILEFIEESFFSSDIGLAKPNPSLFRYVAAELGVETSQIMHIGDNPNADYRATEAGCQALVYAPDGSDLPHIRALRDLTVV